jgi:hypothetical protein
MLYVVCCVLYVVCDVLKVQCFVLCLCFVLKVPRRECFSRGVTGKSQKSENPKKVKNAKK